MLLLFAVGTSSLRLVVSLPAILHVVIIHIVSALLSFLADHSYVTKLLVVKALCKSCSSVKYFIDVNIEIFK